MVFMRTTLNKCRNENKSNKQIREYQHIRSGSRFDATHRSKWKLNWIEFGLLSFYVYLQFSYNSMRCIIFSSRICSLSKSKQLNRLRLHSSISNWIFVSSSLFPDQQPLNRHEQIISVIVWSACACVAGRLIETNGPHNLFATAFRF